jgi:hypothetical protein
MKKEDFFFNCSKDYVKSVGPFLYEEITETVAQLPRRETPSGSEDNPDLFREGHRDRGHPLDGCFTRKIEVITLWNSIRNLPSLGYVLLIRDQSVCLFFGQPRA